MWDSNKWFCQIKDTTYYEPLNEGEERSGEDDSTEDECGKCMSVEQW